MKTYVLFNILGGTRLEFESENIVQASAAVVKEFINRKKKWEAKPTERYKEEDAVMLDGYSSFDGEKIFLLVITKEEVDKQKDLFDGWEDVRSSSKKSSTNTLKEKKKYGSHNGKSKRT